VWYDLSHIYAGGASSGGGANLSGSGGKGGDGGLYGAGGSGGGAIRNDASDPPAASGAGGNGAQGAIIIIEYLLNCPVLGKCIYINNKSRIKVSFYYLKPGDSELTFVELDPSEGINLCAVPDYFDFLGNESNLDIIIGTTDCTEPSICTE